MSGPTSPGSPDGPLPSRSRMLVLCFDGTSNEYDGENTNVVKFFAMLRKDCDDEQLCYYQTGIGTYLPPGMWSALSMWIAKIADEAIAWYLDAHVMDGYRFIMKNYRPGDKISIFGFSRGAYTARALAGFLTKIGLLPRDNDEQVTFAYKMYQRTDKEGLILAAGFKETFCRPVNIEFLGVWDTVASTGVIMSQDLPFTTNNTLIKTFRHALSLDEHRAKFVPTFWTLSTPQPPKPKPGQGATPAAVASSAGSRVNAPEAANSPGGASDADAQRSDAQEAHLLDSNKKSAPGREKKRRGLWLRFGKSKANGVHGAFSTQESDLDTTDVKQVWFAGCHSDVGGGAEKNNADGMLSDIPLRWMVREVVASQCGIQFDAATMARLNVHVSLPGPEYFAAGINGTTPPGPRPSEVDITADQVDSTKPLHDELKLDPLWWILEIIPLPFTWQDAKAKWHKKWEFHLGKGRYVNTSGPLLFHETVRMRMNDTTLKYTPHAIYEKGKESYVW
ncbi:uncharacterized protein FOMMEDRAFT_162480 [Fomitiporia mediterranea MF3/22]|uniref:uncharacterized protein n=1 Tax=Fomitiporia mediterranea (strain MF3/22) TaxID=694068 RepID=UPI000440799F|nr:uncharacterized protein FOMMEDRAFT_162480 [Fomitiporia mediterranea MF3/22]EJC98126.1 hypothetical protein FOMMEDRAFT_162480 [Fomitiporia mediterranea MF3/22]